VLAEQHDRAAEVRIVEARPGHEELSAQRGHDAILARPEATGRASDVEERYARTRIVKTLLIGAPLSEKAYTVTR
jgi:hypothetical protein